MEQRARKAWKVLHYLSHMARKGENINKKNTNKRFYDDILPNAKGGRNIAHIRRNWRMNSFVLPEANTVVQPKPVQPNPNHTAAASNDQHIHPASVKVIHRTTKW